MFRLGWAVLSVWASLMWARPTFAAEELKQLLNHLLAVPTIEAAPGLTAKVLVPPGSFYLVVSDINGDFHVGQRELPDGFLVTIGVQ